jgi:hypothetical protein
MTLNDSLNGKQPMLSWIDPIPGCELRILAAGLCRSFRNIV